MVGSPLKVAAVFGTRPETIKMFPVVRSLEEAPELEPLVVLTGQHREMVDEILEPLGLQPTRDLEVMQPGQSLNEVVARLLPLLDECYAELRPDTVLVQGDTSSALAAALAAFHRQIPVAHLEAGLRSFDRAHPFPEEANRRMITSLASLHFAPTPTSSENLRREGVPADDIVVTGNTCIDGLQVALERCGDKPKAADFGEPLVLVTLHRRESWYSGDSGSSPLERALGAIAGVARSRPTTRFVLPVHRNPRVTQIVHRVLGESPNVELVAPLPYFAFVDLLSSAAVVVTDSGGIQEEAPSLGVPVVVVRETTERPEGLLVGTNHLAGLDPHRVATLLTSLLDDRNPWDGELRSSPFGDGHASERVRAGLLHFFDRGPKPSDFSPAEVESIGATREPLPAEGSPRY